MRQHHAIAIGNDAAIGHSGHDGDAVVLGPRLVMLVLDHLQPEKAGEEQEKGEQHEAARHGQAPLDAVEDTIARARHYGAIARDALAIFPAGAHKSALLETVDFCVDRAY